MPLLQSSPTTLPVEPRVIYTTSGSIRVADITADGGPTDAQLLTYRNSYSVSKCLGEIVVNGLDEKYGSPSKNTPAVRCLSAGPGAFFSKNGQAAYAHMGILAFILDYGYILLFAMVSLSALHMRLNG